MIIDLLVEKTQMKAHRTDQKRDCRPTMQRNHRWKHTKQTRAAMAELLAEMTHVEANQTDKISNGRPTDREDAGGSTTSRQEQ